MTTTPPGRVRDPQTCKLLFVCADCGRPCQSKRRDKRPQCAACFNAEKRANSNPLGKKVRPCKMCDGPTYAKDQICAACNAAYGLPDPRRTTAEQRNNVYAFDPPPPPEPTDSPPGSDGKMGVLVWRAANGFALWHPRDNVPRVESYMGHRNSGVHRLGPLLGVRRDKVASDAFNDTRD